MIQINWIGLNFKNAHIFSPTALRRGTPGDKADVAATQLPLKYRISTLSFPLQSCRSRMRKIVPLKKWATNCIGSDSYGAGTRV